MAANTICMTFKVGPDFISSPDLGKKLVRLFEICLGPLTREPVSLDLTDSEQKLLVAVGQDNSHATLRLYNHGLITLDVQHLLTSFNTSPCSVNGMKVGQSFAVCGSKLQISEEYIRTMESKLKQSLGTDCLQANSLLTPIKRNDNGLWPYVITADERLMELDYDKVLHESESRWQNIRIVHSKEHGAVLCLDGDLMLGESDLIYTNTLICEGQEDFCGKTVLILGGGDGGILHELLKQNPKHIIMAEIDMEVIKACRTHMRSVCGSDMDQLEGPNYKIVIEDCIKVLHESIQNNVQYDYVINDLTEFPVDKAVKGYNYDFETTSLITELSLKATKPTGKLLARGNCISASDYHKSFEGDLHKLGCGFKRKEVYVPSFHETYCLYEIWRKGTNGTNGTSH